MEAALAPVEPDDDTIGKSVRIARLARGWTQRQLSRACGYSSTSLIDNIEHDRYKRRPHDETLLRIAKATSCDALWLIEHAGERPRSRR